MKGILITVLALLCLATSAFAGQRVYLKDGGVIDAKSVRRVQGKIQVLINRDTLTEFWPSEIDMKRTFPKHHRKVKKAPAVPKAATPGEATTTTPNQNAEGKSRKLPSLPKLPEARPENLMPKQEEGTIKKHKREMLERTGE